MTDLTMPTHFCQAVMPVSRGPLPIWMVLLGAAVLLAATILGINAIRALLSRAVWRKTWMRLLSSVRASPVRFCVLIVLAGVTSGVLYWALCPIETATLAAGGPANDSQWTMFHADAARTGRGDSSSPPVDSTLAWKFRESLILERLPFACSPAIAGQRVLIGGDAHKLYCLNLDDGAPQWTFEAKAGIFCSPAVWNGRVYVGEGLHQNRDCKLYCLDLRNGTALWSVTTTSHTESSPTVQDGRAYFGAGEDGVYCVDAMTGREIRHLRKGHVDSSPLVVAGRVYVGSGYGLKGLLCIDAANGEILWTRELPAAC